MTGETLCYLYGVVDAAAATSPPVEHGVEGAGVRYVPSGALAGVVSEVPASRFGEAALRANLENLDWLAETARAHHRVVDAINRVAAVLPVRMATVLLGPDQVVELLDEQRRPFTAALDRVRGRQEWGVKAYLGRAEPSVTTDAAAVPPAARPGTAYLLRKRGERERAERAAATGARRAGELHEALAALAVDSRVYPAQDPRLSGRSEPMLLNAAYLVADADVAALRAVLADYEAADSDSADLDPAGLRVELTGPWAPYSFAGPVAAEPAP